MSRDYFAPYGELLNTATDPVKYRFTGQERDAETGLDYFGARYYASTLGRFTAPDRPFADQYPEDPQSWNLYSYVRNSPLAFTDPTGRRKLSIFFKVVTKYIDTGSGTNVFKKVTKHRMSRDEARREFRKLHRDVSGSRKGAKNTAGRGAIEEPAHTRGLGDRNPHFHDAERSGPHAFYKDAGLMIPGATLGVDLFGDNLVGEVVDFFNPLSDFQGIADLVEDLIDALTFSDESRPEDSRPDTCDKCQSDCRSDDPDSK